MRSRMDELALLAEENDGFFTAEQARNSGVTDSVLTRLAQRKRLERVARGVYRISLFPASRFSQYRESILWVKANRGPQRAALSHETALSVYGISDANPSRVHITVPTIARLRRKRPKWITLHRSDIEPSEIVVQEGMPVTTIHRTIRDILATTARTELARQATADARRQGLITAEEAKQLKLLISRHVRDLKNPHPTERTSQT
jgi:predicted transcriptional regulator of viral defense system